MVCLLQDQTLFLQAVKNGEQNHVSVNGMGRDVSLVLNVMRAPVHCLQNRGGGMMSLTPGKKRIFSGLLLALFLVMGTAAAKDSNNHGQATAKENHVKGAIINKAAPEKKAVKEDHTAAASHATSHETYEVIAGEALRKLLEGNKRYVAEKFSGTRKNAARRTAIAKGQHPFAVILGCSDSRVPPELVFDQGLGDLFVVRTAGNIADDVALGSIEYAVEHLGVRLIMVLGHERCGAVDATVKGGEAPGHIKTVCTIIKPAVEKAKGKHGDMVDNSVKANIRMVAERLKTSHILGEFLEEGSLRIVGGYYDLDTGAVAVTYNPCRL